MTNLDSFDNDNGTEYDDNEIECDDEKIEANEEDHEENETQRGGARFVKKKHGNTIDHHETGIAIPTGTDVLAPDVPEEEVEVRRGKTAEDDEERETKRPSEKQRFKERLAVAMAQFGKLPKLPKEPANDNVRPTVSWPLMDQLTRSTFEPDKERRAKMTVTARYIRELIDMAIADQVGASVHLPGKSAATDYDVQRTESGKVFFEHGQTLDRKKVTYDDKNGEADAERYSGAVRTSKNSLPVGNSGFDLPFPVRVMAAREELAVITAAVGPLWPHLLSTMIQNYSMTDIGEALGVKSAQASIVGTSFIRFALIVAMEALDRINQVKDEPQRKLPMPEKSRGHFLNLSRNHVVAKNDAKIAA
jgi:hypothetical protein